MKRCAANEIWYELISGSAPDREKAERFWQEIRSAWSAPGRFYHNMEHLERLLELWQAHRDEFERPLEAAMAIFYHDIIYVPGMQDNEQQSADRAETDLNQLGLSPESVHRIASMIRATAGHRKTGDADTNLLLDMDLAILGASAGEYRQYARRIRKEFHDVPEEAFVRGRRDFLGRMLASPRIFITDAFHSVREESARANMEDELKELVPE